MDLASLFQEVKVFTSLKTTAHPEIPLKLKLVTISEPIYIHLIV
jgi:hypothetical protein